MHIFTGDCISLKKALPGVRIKPVIVRVFACASGQNKWCPACPDFARLFTFRKRANIERGREQR